MGSAIHFDNLGETLFRQLKTIGSEKASPTAILNAEKIIGGLITGLETSVPDSDGVVKKEIRAILKHLKDTRKDILAGSNTSFSREKLSDANLSLDEVIKATEDTANSIMDSVDELQNIANLIGGKHAERLNEVATRILESCTFQDLIGQRISRVIKTLNYVEEKITYLARIYGIQDLDDEDISYEQSLMNGPQHDDKVPNQDDIDKLFNRS